MNRYFLGSLVLLGVAFCGQPASAGTISLSMKVGAQVQGETLRVSVEVVNQGTESAYNGQVEISVLGQSIVSDTAPEYRVGKPVVHVVKVKLEAQAPGTYPVIVTARYADANQYPFSALASHVFSWRSTNSACDVVGKIEPMTLAARGKAVLALKNMGEKEVSATTRLVVPRELTADGGAVPIVLPGRSDRTLTFAVANFSANAGSTYPVLAVSEFDSDGRHQTTIAKGLVKVVEKKEILGLNYSILAGILIAMVLALIIFQRFKK